MSVSEAPSSSLMEGQIIPWPPAIQLSLRSEQVSGYWVIEGVSPGTAQVQFTAPNGQQGILAITVTEDGTPD